MLTRVRRSRCVRVIAAALLGGAVLLVAPGCLLVAAGAGLGAMLDPEDAFEGSVAGQPPRVVMAAATSLGEINISVLTWTFTDEDGEISARTLHDKPVTITVTRLNETASAVAIRVGTIEDEAACRRILEHIRARLRGTAGALRAMGGA
jgi:hypothetical protein